MNTPFIILVVLGVSLGVFFLFWSANKFLNYLQTRSIKASAPTKNAEIEEHFR